MLEIKKDPIKMYLIFNIGICYVLGILELLFKNGQFYEILGIGFTFFPVICAAITKRITKTKAKYHLSLKVWNNIRAWSFSAVVPGVMIVLGAVLYFVLFPQEYSGIFKYGMRLGTDAEFIIKNPLFLACTLVLLGAIMIPIQLLELGEEIGWRGWLLGFQVEKYGEKKAVLINGFEWGILHLPLIYFGFNYSLDNAGAPWTNMLMMVLVCIVLGIVFSYITIRTENCMYAAIMHGVTNVIGELPVYMTIRMESGLLGPNPTGLLGMMFLFVLAIVLFIMLKSKSVDK